MVVEQEDEETRKNREQVEEKELMELVKNMERDDATWEERKKMARELRKKRGRTETKNEDDAGEEEMTEEGRGRKMNKLKFTSPLEAVHPL